MEKIEKIIDTLECAIHDNFAKGLDQVNCDEMGKALDMLKDATMAQYYMTVNEAMSEADNKTIADYRNYVPQRDMDRMYYTEPMMRPRYYTEPAMDMPKYYGERPYRMDAEWDDSGNGMNKNRPGRYPMWDSSMGKSAMSRKGFIESKELHSTGSEIDQIKNRQELDKWIDDMSEDIKSLMGRMNNEEKTVLRTRMASLVSSLQ